MAFPQYGEPTLGKATQRRLVQQNTMALRRAAPYPAAKLVQLRQAHALRILDNHQAGIWHVHAHFDNGCCDQ